MPRRINSFDYVVQHGKAISACGLPFDSCQNEAVTGGLVTLTNYHIVRHFESLGTWKGQTVDFSLGPDVVAEYAGRPDQDMAVLVQTEGVGPILAAERLGTGRP